MPRIIDRGEIVDHELAPIIHARLSTAPARALRKELGADISTLGRLAAGLPVRRQSVRRVREALGLPPNPAAEVRCHCGAHAAAPAVRFVQLDGEG